MKKYYPQMYLQITPWIKLITSLLGAVMSNALMLGFK